MVEPDLNRISSGTLEHHLEPRSMDILVYLLEHANAPVSTETLLDVVWVDRVVEPNAVHRCITQIRRVLGDDPRRPRYIETIRKRGYRTVGAVEQHASRFEEHASSRNHRNWRTFAIVAATLAMLVVGIGYYHRDSVLLALALNVPVLFFGQPIKQDLGFAKAADGTRIAYATSGQGPPILHVLTINTDLEAGQNSPIYDNEKLVAMSSEDHHFIRFDGRGTGLSDRGVEDYSLSARLRDIEAVVDAVGLDRFSILAVSAGGQAAIAYSAQNPDRVDRLVLGGAVASYDFLSRKDRSAFKRMIDVYEHGWHRPEVPSMHASMILGADADRLGLSFFSEMLRRSMDGPDLAGFLRASLTIDVRDQAERLRVPTLVLQARDDRVVPLEVGRELASIIPGAQLKIVDGSHMASSASTSVTRKLALDFLSQGYNQRSTTSAP